MTVLGFLFIIIIIIITLLLKIFKEGGPSVAAVFQEALHLNTKHSRKGKVKSLITIYLQFLHKTIEELKIV